MITLIGGEKGGTGKTTLATNIAAARAIAGFDVIIVDTDQQGSASHWVATRDEREDAPRISCVQVFGKSVTEQVRDLAERYDDVIVDAGGRDSTELRAAMVTANQLHIPLQASQFDVWTLERMNDLLDQVTPINPGLFTGVVINRASPHPQVDEANEAADIVNDYEHLDFTGVTVHDRIAFRRAISKGLSVLEADKRDPKACAEIESLYESVYGIKLKYRYAKTTAS